MKQSIGEGDGWIQEPRYREKDSYSKLIVSRRHFHPSAQTRKIMTKEDIKHDVAVDEEKCFGCGSRETWFWSTAVTWGITGVRKIIVTSQD